ncbi:MAG: zf-HC2 domain-containing protein, partial [Candidatus Omnitrophica bacterium]|nr:zf-HC2 domain-containing protein [Candidatus Omnitrophota bacterium]
MQCKEIQDLLKADYFDGEASQRDQRQVLEHLDSCGKCRKLEEELRTQRVLFQKEKLQNAPESLWQNIREAIIKEQLNQEENAGYGVLSRLKELFLGQRPAFALASVFTLILCIAIFTGVFMQERQSPVQV